MTAAVIRADARSLPLPDASVDLIVTSPPYFGLRSYTDGGAHYDGQIGSEGTPQEWLAVMVACVAEMARVLKPSGSIFINVGDKYAGTQPGSYRRDTQPLRDYTRSNQSHRLTAQVERQAADVTFGAAREKSLLGLPWRLALACTDQLGLILRRDIIWAKPNGLPESVTDRCRSSHEYVFHLVKQPRYYAAVDEIREPHAAKSVYQRDAARRNPDGHLARRAAASGQPQSGMAAGLRELHALGALPGSVWSIPSQPLTVPPGLGVDHFACVDAETEILTPSGWLRHDQLTPGDQVAGYDLDTSTARWTDCTAVNRYDYDGDMIAVESRDLSMRLTPNHRTVVQRMHTRSKRRNPINVVRADELNRYHFIPRSADWESFGDYYIGDRAAAAVGWVAAEGWYQGHCVYLSQSLEANAPHVAEIDRLVPDAGNWTRTERKRTYKGKPWTEVTWKLGLASVLVQHVMPKKLLPWFLVTATEPERRAALDAFIAGDGHRRPDGRIGIFQKHRHNLDVLQAVAVTLGYKTTLREGAGRFVLYLTEGGRSVTLRGTSGVGSKVGREHYKGTVWCPTTGTGTFIARRNGSVFVTGNSFPLELPRRCVLGWSPSGVCTACGEGRRPVTLREIGPDAQGRVGTLHGGDRARFGHATERKMLDGLSVRTITGYACACTTPDAPTRPAVVVDPFGGTGTTALVASMLGRSAITIDRSADYCRLATWRTTDPGERARALEVPKPPPVPDGQGSLFEEFA